MLSSLEEAIFKNGAFAVTLTRASPRFWLVTSSMKFCYVSFNFFVFQFPLVYQKVVLCSGKDCCVVERLLRCGKVVSLWKRLLCSGKDCCVLEMIVVFSKQLCSRNDCCV